MRFSIQEREGQKIGQEKGKKEEKKKKVEKKGWIETDKVRINKEERTKES